MEKRIEISDAIRAAAPDYHMVYIEADVVNAPTPDKLRDALDRLAASMAETLTVDRIRLRPGIDATRRAYKACGKDPNRYRPSHEQLTRRIVRGLGLYYVDALVDTGNLVSLMCGSSVGVFDRDRIEGDTLTLGIGRADEPYEGIGRGPLNIGGLPVIRDAAGGIGTPTSDNERTKVSASTRRISVTINVYSADDVSPAEACRMMTEALALYCGATDIESAIF